MPEQYIIDFLVYIANGWISFRYTERFLHEKYENRRRALLIWTLIYTAGQFAVSEFSGAWSPYDRLLNIIPAMLLLFVMQHFFFEKDFAKQAFVITSFEAGWEILRFAVSPMAHAIFSVWSPFWAWLFQNEAVISFLPQDALLSLMEGTNRIAVFVVIALCRGMQVGILALYLRVVSKRFIYPKSGAHGYEIKPHDSMFLLIPCGAVLFIDLTMRLMAYSLDNGAMMLVYDRVPSTLVLLPLVSLMLLGMIISSVILFQNLVQYKDEEQKRVLLENRVAQVHKEIEELTDIYEDIRGLRHDLGNHIAGIAACIRKSGSDCGGELEKYLSRMTDTVARLDFADSTGNPITDIILHQTRQQAKRKGIGFSADFHFAREAGLDAYDVSVILNNALQNALEACEKMEGKRAIEVRSYMRGKFFFIEVENDFSGELKWEKQAELPSTMKKEKSLHGMGLTNMRRCAQKYHGDIDINISEHEGRHRFRIIVMLPARVDED